MKGKLALGFALKNLRANRYLELPFLLASGFMLILFYIMVSLLNNDYVNTRHRSLPMIIVLGIIIAGIFSFVFVMYANRFLIKRRHKEFALYGILGLEKRHIRRILFLEHLINFGILMLISNIGGFFSGKFAFLGLNRLLKDVTGSLMHYPFSFMASFITTVYILALLIFVYTFNVFAIKNASPIELLNKDKKGEGEPKNRIILLLTGFSFLIAGYGIALRIEGVLKSIGFFFLAVIFVMIATYLLFVSFSIFILKLQRRRKHFYYKAKHFLSVSGMLYRMKSNAVGLASLSILSTGVIITLASTLAIYGNIEGVVKNTLARDYQIGYFGQFRLDELSAAKKELNQLVTDALKDDVSDSYMRVSCIGPINREGKEFKPLKKSEFFTPNTLFCIFTTAESYNGQYGKSVKLNKDEILVSANNRSLLKEKDLILGGKEYKGELIENIVPANVGIEAYSIVVADEEVLNEMAGIYQNFDRKGNAINEGRLELSMVFNTNGKEFTLSEKVTEKGGGSYYIESLVELRKGMYELNGGFLFLGIIVGLIFLSGTILITYYKQVSEGIEDRDKYAIMQKIGLPDTLIRKTANVQIVWAFFLPLLVAVIHSLVASKIVYQLLGLFGIHDFSVYGEKLALVGIAFAVIYFVNFKITSNIYYKQVK